MSKTLRLDPETDKALIERIQRQQKNVEALASIIVGPENASPVQTALRNMQAKGRMKSGKLNKTETAFAEFLEQQKAAEEIKWYKHHPFNLRLADNTYYRPDFAALAHDDIMIVYEVKGWWTDDAKVKIKVAADQFPFVFIAVTKTKNGWNQQYF